MAFAWWGWLFVLILVFCVPARIRIQREAAITRLIEERAAFRKYREIREGR